MDTNPVSGCVALIVGLLSALGLTALLGLMGMPVEDDFDFDAPPTPMVATAIVEPTFPPTPTMIPSRTPTPFPTMTSTPIPTVTPIPPSATPVEASDPAQIGDNIGEIELGGGQIWFYEGQEGEILTINVRADNPANETSREERIEQGLLDTIVYVYAPGGELIATADDMENAILTDSEVAELELEVTGTYIIEVRSFGDDSGGGYTLSIKSSLEDEE
jgi:hypothetical protein